MAENVAATVTSNPVVMFSRSACHYCVSAKKYIADTVASDARLRQVKPVVVDLDETVGGAAIGEALVRATGWNRVPSVWICGEFVGGGADTEKYYKEGVLGDMIAKCAEHRR